MQVDLHGQVALVTGAAQGHRPRHRGYAGRETARGSSTRIATSGGRRRGGRRGSMRRSTISPLPWMSLTAPGRRGRRRSRRGGRPHRHSRQQCRHRREGGGSQNHRRISGRDLGGDAAHRSDRRLSRQPRRDPAHEGKGARVASSTSPRSSASCRCACRVPTSPRKPASSTSPARWRSNWRPIGILVNGIAPGSTATEPAGSAGSATRRARNSICTRRLLSHIPLERPATTQEIAQRRALPRSPGKLLHHRPHPSHRRRLDRRLRAGFLSMDDDGRRTPAAENSQPVSAAGWPDLRSNGRALQEHGAPAEIRACGAGRLPEGRDAGLPAPLHRPGSDRRRHLRASAADRLGHVHPSRPWTCAGEGHGPARADGGTLRQARRLLRRTRRHHASLRLRRSASSARTASSAAAFPRRSARRSAPSIAARDGVAVAFFGDGATNHAAFHEALNFAGVRRAPAVLVCENNLYATATALSSVTLNPGDRHPRRGLWHPRHRRRRQRRRRGLAGDAGAPCERARARRRADADRGQDLPHRRPSRGRSRSSASTGRRRRSMPGRKRCPVETFRRRIIEDYAIVTGRELDRDRRRVDRIGRGRDRVRPPVA